MVWWAPRKVFRVEIHRPNGHRLSVQGSIDEVEPLVSAWWRQVTKEEGPPKRVVGFQMGEK